MVNVIIPCYNGKDLLKETLYSLVIQTKKMFITTVVDDCSTEDIKSVVEEFRDKLHIKYLKTKVNGGPGAARNVGIEDAIANNYDYVIFLDSDDILYPRAIEVLTREIMMSDLDVVSSNIDVDGFKKEKRVIDTLNLITWVHGRIYRTSVLKKKNIRFIDYLKSGEDGEFNNRFDNLTEKKGHIEEVTHFWRDNKHSITRSNNSKNFEKIVDIDMIRAYCYTIRYMQENNLVDNQMFANVITNIYYHFNIAFSKSTLTPEIFNECKEVFQLPVFTENFRKGYMHPEKLVTIGTTKERKFIFRYSLYELLKLFNREDLAKEYCYVN